MSLDDALNEAIQRFRATEEALRSVLESAGELKSAGEQMDEARGQAAATMADSVSRLDSVEQTVRDTASGIYRMAEELRSQTRDLGDVAQALIRFDPDMVLADVEEIRLRQRELEKAAEELAGLMEQASLDREKGEGARRRSTLLLVSMLFLIFAAVVVGLFV